jgi:hypothetical protein
MDPNIAKIIERTRARRPFVGGGGSGTGETPLKTAVGGTGERERSPLKPRNFDNTPSSGGVGSGSPRKSNLLGGSPHKASPSDTVKRLLAGEDVATSVRELISRYFYYV